MAARFGAAAPSFLISATTRVHPNFHYLLYITLSCIGIGVTWLLRETKGQGLPETLGEVAKGQSIHRRNRSESSEGEFHKIEIYNDV